MIIQLSSTLQFRPGVTERDMSDAILLYLDHTAVPMLAVDSLRISHANGHFGQVVTHFGTSLGFYVTGAKLLHIIDHRPTSVHDKPIELARAFTPDVALWHAAFAFQRLWEPVGETVLYDTRQKATISAAVKHSRKVLSSEGQFIEWQVGLIEIKAKADESDPMLLSAIRPKRPEFHNHILFNQTALEEVIAAIGTDSPLPAVERLESYRQHHRGDIVALVRLEAGEVYGPAWIESVLTAAWERAQKEEK